MLVGDIESMPFIEALGQFSYRVGKKICLWRILGVLVFIFGIGSWSISSHQTLSVSGVGNFCLIHVSLVPVLNAVGEQVVLRKLDSI